MAFRETLEYMPPAQPEYTELTPEEAASEIASGSIMSASYWLDVMIRLKQMGYAICRKNQEKIIYCMNCKFYDMRGYCDREQDCEAGVLMNPDDFCSRAERK